VLASEERSEEKEHVQDVEEDRRREERRRPDVLRAAETLEVVQRDAREDHEPGDGVDQGPARDLDEDRDDAEHDQREQRPEQVPSKRRQIAACRIADRPYPGDEESRGPSRLPEDLRVGARVVADSWRERETDEQPESEQEADGERLRTLNRDID